MTDFIRTLDYYSPNIRAGNGTLTESDARSVVLTCPSYSDYAHIPYLVPRVPNSKLTVEFSYLLDNPAHLEVPMLGAQVCLSPEQPIYVTGGLTVLRDDHIQLRQGKGVFKRVYDFPNIPYHTGFSNLAIWDQKCHRNRACLNIILPAFNVEGDLTNLPVPDAERTLRIEDLKISIDAPKYTYKLVQRFDNVGYFRDNQMGLHVNVHADGLAIMSTTDIDVCEVQVNKVGANQGNLIDKDYSFEVYPIYSTSAAAWFWFARLRRVSDNSIVDPHDFITEGLGRTFSVKVGFHDGTNIADRTFTTLW